jgi:Cell division protein
MKLVGANWAFIRRPFLRRKFWKGVLAAFIADSILWGAAYWLVSYEPELVKVNTPEVMVLVSGAVLVFGVPIYVAVRFAFHQQISEDEGKHTVLY